MRADGRAVDKLRSVKIVPYFLSHLESSVLISAGNTVVLCVASVNDSVPSFLNGSGTGWITAEYGMLPASTVQRKQRERKQVDGRTFEIQRLIGRSLRCVIDRQLLGERTLLVDCDVIQADGGTRTIAISGAYVAAVLAAKKLLAEKKIAAWPIRTEIAAISVGIVNGEVLLDLDYKEDSNAEVDLNVVMNGKGEFAEVQSTGEKKGFTDEQLNQMLGLGKKGILEMMTLQKKALGAL